MNIYTGDLLLPYKQTLEECRTETKKMLHDFEAGYEKSLAYLLRFQAAANPIIVKLCQCLGDLRSDTMTELDSVRLDTVLISAWKNKKQMKAECRNLDNTSYYAFFSCFKNSEMRDQANVVEINLESIEVYTMTIATVIGVKLSHWTA